MTRRLCLMLAMVVVLAALMTVGVMAQSMIRGQVTDEWGNGLKGVSVVAQSAGGGTPREDTTDDDGNFRFPNILGEFTFEFRLSGYQPLRIAESVSGMRMNRPLMMKMPVLSTGNRFRDDTDFEVEGGVPKIQFKTDGNFDFEDADGEGEGTYGIVELECFMVVRDYDGPDDRYSVNEPVVGTFSNDRFTDMMWGELELAKQ